MKPLFFSIALLVQTIATAQTIERIEPQNWWTGMKYNTITLLIYGNDISALEPTFSYKDVQLVKKQTTENKNYLFLTIKINPAAKAGIVKINFKQNGKTVLTKDFPLLEREKNSAYRTSYSQKDAIYLIVPDRFVNGDTTNDVVPSLLEKTVNRNDEGKRHGGDIQGILNHLDYIQSLGFTQIWCTLSGKQ
ncbi:MAG: cyclomaltodextrinase N-terminal domain-containing protein [Chitinophagaceae bacterium]